MNLRAVAKQLKLNIMAGNAVVLQSDPGIGKSDLVVQIAHWFKDYANEQFRLKRVRRRRTGPVRVGFSTIFMATQNPLAFVGIPWKSTRTIADHEGNEREYTVTDPAIPQWAQATCLDTGVVMPVDEFDAAGLVIEEWGQGQPETKRAAAEILRVGGTPPFYLPELNFRVATTNIDSRDGITKEFDFIKNRRVELNVHGDVKVWLEDFAAKGYRWGGRDWTVLPVTKAWAEQHPEILFEKKPEKQGQWCTPRSLTSCDRYVQCAMNDNNGEIPLRDPGFIDNVAGTIGMAAGVSYCQTMEFLLELPAYENVVTDPKGTEVPTRADLQMLMAYQLASRATADELAPVLTYVGRLSKDMSITFVNSLLNRDYKSIINAPAMQAWIAKNAALVSLIAPLRA